MARIRLHPWDSAAYLKTNEDAVLYLEACLDEGDPALIAHSLHTIARACGMMQLARDIGVSRETLNTALSGTGNPEFATVMNLLRTPGFRLRSGATHG